MTDVDNPRYDTFTILSSMAAALKKYHGSSEFADLIAERFILSRALLHCPWKFPHRMGQKKDGTYFHDNQDSDHSDYVPREDEVRSNISIMNDEIFTTWRVSKTHFNQLDTDQLSNVYRPPAKPAG
jgi:hypothetical protein